MKFNKYKEWGDYHWREYANKTLYGQHADFVKSWIEEKDILDIGCGDGLITSLIGAIGIDDDSDGLALARNHKVNVNYGSAYEIPIKLHKFEAVFLGDVIEHLEFPQKALKDIQRVLSPKGLLYIATPPATDDRKLQDPYHYREYTPQELEDELKKGGFDLVEPITINFKRMYGKFRKS